MITKTVNLYTFDELSDKAKERARDWWRQSEGELFADTLEYEPIETAAKLLGIEFKTRDVKLMGGGTRAQLCIWWTLHVQGAGASYDATYHYARGSVKAIKAKFPTDTTLQRIAHELAETQRKYRYRITASITADSRYHSLDVEAQLPEYDYEGTTTRELAEPLKSFADWIYRTIDAEYSARMEDEYVDDAIKANEYTFTADGKRENP